jgi:hypothetical protein
MATLTLTTPRAAPVTTVRRDLIVVLAGLWPVTGLYLDGWAHTHVAQLETFFTPWHAVLYSGFVVHAGTLVPSAWYRQRPYGPFLERVPVGYGLGLLGALLFAIGGLADMIWHSILGVEVDLEALLSPPHLLLLTAGTLMMATPVRAAGARPARPVQWLGWLPAILSVFAVSAVAAFFLEYLSPFLDVPAASGHGSAQVLGVGEYLLTTVLLVVPLLYAWGRLGRIPPGMITAVGLAVAVPVGVLNDFQYLAGQLWALAGAVAVDVAVQVVGTRRPRLVPVVAGASVPALVWPLHLLGVALTVGIVWTVELWAGVIVLSALAGAVLGGLLLPYGPGRSGPSAAAGT